MTGYSKAAPRPEEFFPANKAGTARLLNHYPFVIDNIQKACCFCFDKNPVCLRRIGRNEQKEKTIGRRALLHETISLAAKTV